MRLNVMCGWLAAALAGTGAIFSIAAELPAISVPVCAKAPMLDGKLDDPAWQQAAKIDKLYLINSDQPVTETQVWLMRDNTWLYIAAQCRNTNMAHVPQLMDQRDGALHKDDSLEFFIRPVTNEDAPYFHFALTFANVGKEQRCNKAGLREIDWNPPWRTVTQRQPDGWTAEIAVPLYCLGNDDLSGMSMNICRNMMKVEADAQGAAQNETIVASTLRPDNKGGFHDFVNFQSISGMGGFKPEAAFFAPQIVTASVSGVRQDAGKKFYDLNLVLDIATPVPGAAQLKVVEDFGQGEVEALSQPVDVKGRTELELKIPAGDLQARKIKVALKNPADGNLLSERELVKVDLVKGVISKDKQPFYREGAVPAVRTASYVVAAADSPSHVKAQADFICEGLDDHIVINAAIEALPANGGRVHLAAGTFSIGGVEGTHGGISILRSNVMLTGEGSGTRLILQPGQSHINVIWIHGNIKDITVRDLFINGNGTTQAPWIVKKFGWKGGSGIKAIDDRNVVGPTPCNVKVENCHIENCQVMAVMMSGASVEVLNCYFSGTFGSHVIELLGDSGRIEGCTLRVKNGDSVGFGFSTDASYFYNIINNKIFVDAGGIIRSHPINNWPVHRYGGPTITNRYHGIISGNMVVNNGKAGAVLIDGYMDIVNNNIFRGVPVIIGAPEGGMGVIFDHNMLINSGLTINSPLRGDECVIYVDGNTFFNSSVTNKDGNVVWGTNPGKK